MLNKSMRTIWRYDPDVEASNIDEIVKAILIEYNKEPSPPAVIELITNAYGLNVAIMLALNGLPVKKMKKTVRGIVEDEPKSIKEKLKKIESMNFWERLRALFCGIKL